MSEKLRSNKTALNFQASTILGCGFFVGDKKTKEKLLVRGGPSHNLIFFKGESLCRLTIGASICGGLELLVRAVGLKRP